MFKIIGHCDHNFYFTSNDPDHYVEMFIIGSLTETLIFLIIYQVS